MNSVSKKDMSFANKPTRILIEMIKDTILITVLMLSILYLPFTSANSFASESQTAKSGTSEPEAGLKLKELRNEIDVINQEIIVLLNKRAEVVLEIGEMKKKNSMEVYDPVREKAIEDKLTKINTGPLPNESVIKIFREIIAACRALE